MVCFALFQRRTIDDLLLLSAVEEEKESGVETLLLELVAKEPRPFERSFRIYLEILDDQVCINLFRCENKILILISVHCSLFKFDDKLIEYIGT